jgi:hypothetical protein
MHRPSKVQRIESLEAPPQTDQSDQRRESKGGSVALLAEDHSTTTSYVQAKVQHFYDVKSGEFSLGVTAENGEYVNVKVRTNGLYERIGVKRTIPDVKATINSVKMLQKAELQPGTSAPEETVAPSAALKTIVTNELGNLARYGSSLFVTVKHPVNKENADYRVNVSTRGETIVFSFKSVELDRNTGSTSYNITKLASIVASTLGVDENDTDFKSALQTSSKKIVCNEEIKLRVTEDKIALSVRLPSDSFSYGATVFADVGFLYFV